MEQEGKSKATVGIYLRAARIPINECLKQGFIKRVQYPFGTKREKKVVIPNGKKRVNCYIDIPTINKINKLSDGITEDVRKSIALWMFSYLSGGMNLLDVALLSWNDYYFKSGEAELQYVRNKTKDGTDGEMETLIPITEDLRKIFNQYGSTPEPGKKVFPFIIGIDNPTEKEIYRRTQQINQNVRKHMHKVCKILEIPQEVSPTWARHSFKANATHAGVPREYIELAMGHSIHGPEGNYFANYPLKKRLDFTRMLLVDSDEITSRLNALSTEDLLKVMEILNAKK